MSIQLRKSPFKRNRSREKTIGDIFNKASTGLNSALSLALTLFFTPVLMATSLFSQEIILMLANLSLCFGNLLNFANQIYNKNIGMAELLVSVAILLVFIAGAYFLFPAIASTSGLLGGIALANQIAVGVNVFFLLKNHIVPPLLGGIKYLGTQLGMDIQDKCYQVKPLDKKQDAAVVNVLMHKHFQHSVYEDSVEEDITKLNQLVSILVDYINKYDETLLGEVKYNQVVSDLKGHMAQLTLQGNADSSFAFIKQKLAYKQVKRRRLEDAKVELTEGKEKTWQLFSTYFKGVSSSVYQANSEQFHDEAVQLLDDEISRQTLKIERLSSCLP